MKCAVANCNSFNESKACNLSFFGFPTNDALRKKWVSFCRREKSFNPKNCFVCMLHFKSEDIINRLKYDMGFTKYRLLKKGAVPTINTDPSIANDELSEQCSSRKKKREKKKIAKSNLKKLYDDDERRKQQREQQTNKAEDENLVCGDPSERERISCGYEHAKANHYAYKWHQRMEEIREYDKQNPNLTVEQLAKKFHLTEVLMKNILDNRESALKFYEEELVVKRQEKIDLLDKVMYEYVQRAMHCNLCLDEVKMLQKAQEVKDGIDIANFDLTISWLNDFKLKYNITGFDIETLEKVIKRREMKRCQQLTALDMIAYVIIEEKKEENKKRNPMQQKRGNKIAKVLVETSITSTQAAVMPEDEDVLIVESEKEDTAIATMVTNVPAMPEDEDVLIVESEKEDTVIATVVTNVTAMPENEDVLIVESEKEDTVIATKVTAMPENEDVLMVESEKEDPAIATMVTNVTAMPENEDVLIVESEKEETVIAKMVTAMPENEDVLIVESEKEGTVIAKMVTNVTAMLENENWSEKDDTETATMVTNVAAMPENENELIVKSEKDNTKAVTNVFKCLEDDIAANPIGLRVESADSIMSEIKSVEDAVEHLRLLEEFSMLQDNFRAIGLLTQLEQAFKQNHLLD